ncbi:MAG: flavin reductase family protein [Pseudomonadota bacterium]
MENTLSAFDPKSEDRAALRRAFSRFGTGVTVVTTQTDQGPTGITANSFSSVSLDPALVLWSVAHRSERSDAFMQAQAFCVHILAANQESLAHHFAARGHSFDNIDWTIGPNGAPTLSDVLATFHCNTFATHPAGDHTIIVGEVTHASNRPDNAAGLLFERSSFGQFQKFE